MNKKQRDSNRKNAQRIAIIRRVPCPECGDPGPHFVAPMFGTPGFFVCDKFYGDDGRRLPEYVDPAFRW